VRRPLGVSRLFRLSFVVFFGCGWSSQRPACIHECRIRHDRCIVDAHDAAALQACDRWVNRCISLCP
jgi:hypothetical protein